MTEQDDSLASPLAQVETAPADAYDAFAAYLAKVGTSSAARRLSERLSVVMTPDGEHHLLLTAPLLRLTAPLDAVGLPGLIDGQHLVRARPERDES